MVAFAVKTPPQHGRWAEFLDVWKAADDIEVFESAWVMDHFYPLTPPLDGTHLESWTMLAALAMATRRLRLGCMVNGMHYRHPAVTANAAVTIDHISGGRFVLGLGAGWFEPESNAYGIPLGTLTERFDRFDEGVEVICSLLANEVTNFSGRYYVLTDARCNPKPVQSRLPIAIGGKGPKRTLPTVARWADHWDTVATDAGQWKALSDVLDGECAAIGRQPAEIRRSVHLMWEAAADPVELAARAAEFGDAGVDLVIFSMRGPTKPAFSTRSPPRSPAEPTSPTQQAARPRVPAARHPPLWHLCASEGWSDDDLRGDDEVFGVVVSQMRYRRLLVEPSGQRDTTSDLNLRCPASLCPRTSHVWGPRPLVLR